MYINVIIGTPESVLIREVSLIQSVLLRGVPLYNYIIIIIHYSIVSVIQYCHYVAGLVGIGLTRLFAASGLECEEVGDLHKLANSMGLFLQKTNIIRDYLEDNLQEREFWPREVSTSDRVDYCNCKHLYLHSYP